MIKTNIKQKNMKLIKLMVRIFLDLIKKIINISFKIMKIGKST